MTQLPPCHGQPGFLEPPDATDWRLRPEPRAAQRICRNRCPRETLVACARAALTAGTCLGDGGPVVADGVIMAGIICRGDRRTEQALLQVISTQTGKRRRRTAA